MWLKYRLSRPNGPMTPGRGVGPIVGEFGLRRLRMFHVEQSPVFSAREERRGDVGEAPILALWLRRRALPVSRDNGSRQSPHGYRRVWKCSTWNNGLRWYLARSPDRAADCVFHVNRRGAGTWRYFTNVPRGTIGSPCRGGSLGMFHVEQWALRAAVGSRGTIGSPVPP